MKAVLCKSLEGSSSLVIEDIAPPEPGANEVVVRVRATALNFFDSLTVRGKYQLKPELPFSPGGEIAGEIHAVGANVSEFKVGDRVAACLGSDGGARELTVVAQDLLIPVPNGVDDAIAASVSITYGTGLHGLIDRGELKDGETVVVLGAAGGAGLAAVELAKLYGAKVIAVASTEEKLKTAKRHGADIGLVGNAETLKADLRDATDGAGVDIVYDCVGGDLAEPALRALRWGGRFLVIGFASGEIPKIPANLLLVKGCSAVGVFWGASVERDPERHKRNMSQLFQKIADGKLSPRIHGKFSLNDSIAALQVLENREAVGKVVIEVS